MLWALSFLLGLQLMIVLLGSAYRYIDLWYRIKDYWLTITIRFVIALAITYVIFLLLPAPFNEAFISGLGFYLLFHIAIFWIGRLAIWLFEQSR